MVNKPSLHQTCFVVVVAIVGVSTSTSKSVVAVSAISAAVVPT